MEPLVQLAIALAARLTAEFPAVTIAGRAHQVTSLWQPLPDVALESASLREPEIWVIDLGETLTTDHGAGNEEYTLLVILQQKIDAAHAGEQVQVLGRLASQVGRYCRPLEPSESFALEAADVAAVCTKVRRQPARNLDDLRKGLFYTELLTTWKTC